MSSYFDKFDQTIREISCSSHSPQDFLIELKAFEADMVRTCELFAGDRETPDDVRKRIMAAIMTHRVAPAGMDDWTKSRGSQYAVTVMASSLSRELHRIFHDIANMRLQTRYGVVLDNPQAAVEARDLWVEKRERRAAKRAQS